MSDTRHLLIAIVKDYNNALAQALEREFHALENELHYTRAHLQQSEAYDKIGTESSWHVGG